MTVLTRLSAAEAERITLAIRCRMRAERAADWSDAEIERCLSGCGLPTKLIQIAREMRESGHPFTVGGRQ